MNYTYLLCIVKINEWFIKTEVGVNFFLSDNKNTNDNYLKKIINSGDKLITVLSSVVDNKLPKLSIMNTSKCY